MTLTGTGFANAISVQVNFGSTAVNPASYTATQILATIPSSLLLTAGSVNVSVTIRLATGLQYTSNALTFTINPAPSITTASPLNSMWAGSAFSQTLAASGGTPPYGNWRAVEGALPAGLSLAAATGVIAGTPASAGSGSAQITLDDSGGASATKVFSWTVGISPLPTVSITGLTTPLGPREQPKFNVQLSSAYALPITGTITLTFAPNAINQVGDNAAVQFSTGGRTLPFTIAAGQTSAFTTLPSFQTGDVAGQASLTLSYSAGGRDVTPSPAPVWTGVLARAVPAITALQISRGANGFTVLITGFSTSRQVAQAVFYFTPAAGANLQDTSVSPSTAAAAFTTWYTSSTSPQYGSAFLYTQPFTVSGNVGDIASVSVSLAYTEGTTTAYCSPVSLAMPSAIGATAATSESP
jgi:hypothetical protein